MQLYIEIIQKLHCISQIRFKTLKKKIDTVNKKKVLFLFENDIVITFCIKIILQNKSMS